MKNCYVWVCCYDKPEKDFNLMSSTIHAIVESAKANEVIKAIKRSEVLKYVRNAFAWHPSAKNCYVRISAQEISTGKTIAERWM